MTVILAFLPVLLFMASLIYIDSYKLVPVARIAAVIASGGLAAAISYLIHQSVPVDRWLLTRLVDGFRMQGRGERPPRFGTLTKREREILKMLAEGRSVKEIAAEFDLSVKTVEAHKFNLMRKLDIHNKAQLVQYAIQKKVIRLPELVPA